MDYNLLDKDWIPVLYRDGRWKRVTIRRALEDAGDIREVRDSSPLVTFGIYRLLIAVLQWLGGSWDNRDWGNVLRQTRLPPDILNRLRAPEHVRLFDLGDPDQPFYQDSVKLSELRELISAAGKGQLTEAKRKKYRMKTSAYLATEIPTETYKAHFWHASDTETRLCTACCVCGLVTLPPFCIGVGQGNETSINNVPPVYWLIHGERLLDTLLLNLPGRTGKSDAPCWSGANVSDEIGPLEGMTWQARRIAIQAEAVSGGRCDRCGEAATAGNPLVRWIIFANRATRRGDDRRLPTWIDPHIAGGFERKKDRVRFVGLKPNVSPGAWCERVQSLLSQPKEAKGRQAPNVRSLPSRSPGPARCEAVAYMLKSDRADIEHWEEERWPISPAMIAESSVWNPIVGAARQAGQVIQTISETWPEGMWKLRYPDRRPDKNAKKSWKKSAAAAAIRLAIAGLDAQLKEWFRARMCTIADGGASDVLNDLPKVCREAGQSSVLSIAASLSAASAPLDRARINEAAKGLIEGVARKAERDISENGRTKK